MHTANVVVAFALTVEARMRAALADTGLEERELSALTLVAEDDGRAVEWLCERVGLTHSGTVRLVDRLAARGLLHRGPAAGRRVPLHLTDEGAAALRRWADVRDRTVADLLAGVPEEQRGPLVTAMAGALAGQPRRRRDA